MQLKQADEVFEMFFNNHASFRVILLDGSVTMTHID